MARAPAPFLRWTCLELWIAHISSRRPLSDFFSAGALQADLPEAFLEQYCYKCHGADKQQAERRFDTLPAIIKDFRQQEQWQDIVDQLNLGDMPPKDEKQPKQAERLAAVRVMTENIAAAREKFAGSSRHTVLRRLNKVEYQKTISDLLGLNVEAWNPTEDFPSEVTSEGFDNDGDELVTSGLLLEKYFPAAEFAVNRATHFGPMPESKTYAQKSPFYFAGKESSDLPKLFQVDRFRFVPETPYTDLSTAGTTVADTSDSCRSYVREALLTAENILSAFVRRAWIAHTIMEIQSMTSVMATRWYWRSPLWIAAAASPPQENVSKMVSLTTYELTSAEPEWFEWTGYLEKGYEPELRFRNGTSATKRLTRLLINDAEKHPEFKPFALLQPGYERSHGVLKAYRGPKLRIWEIQLEGPHQQRWPPSGHRVLYDDVKLNELNTQTIHDRLSDFASSAFRRPPAEGELQPIFDLVVAKLDAGLKPLDALQLGFQAILCAPGFLYLQEGEGQLEDYALASRLSYFLWSSMPDDELRKLASSGTLGEPETRRQQVVRMLADPKGQRFVSNFTRIWLELDNIGKMPPSREFLSYYRDNLDSAMRQETELFFGHILDHNLPLREFLASRLQFS